MASDDSHYPYPTPSATQQLEQQLAGGAIAAAAAAGGETDQVHQSPQNDATSANAPQQLLDEGSPNPAAVAATIPQQQTPSQLVLKDGRKRKADGTSSRGVANLTPEQLSKKRRNDREAQRAIRSRTRSKIEQLEARIQELESQEPFQELQNAIRARDAVIAENEDLKSRLASITSMSTFSPQSSSTNGAPVYGLDHLALATSRQDPLPTSEAHNSGSPSAHAPHSHYMPEASQEGQAEAQPDSAEDHEHERRAPYAPLTDHAHSSFPAADIAGSHRSLPLHYDYQEHGLDAIFKSVAAHEATSSLEDDNPLHQSPALNLLLSAEESSTIDSYGFLNWNTIKTIKTLSPRNGVLEPLTNNAYFCVYFFFFRWFQRHSDRSQQQDMFEFLIPTRIQQTARHVACIDLIPWPGMRDFLIMNEKDYPDSEAILESVVQETTIDRPHGLAETSVRDIVHHLSGGGRETVSSATDQGQRGDHDPQEEQHQDQQQQQSAENKGASLSSSERSITITTSTPAFEDHIRFLENWSLSPEFAREYPALVEAAGARVTAVE